jgi:hypothetical protein
MNKNADNIVYSIGEFVNTILWMSMRYWMCGNRNHEIEPNYPEKMTDRYWGGLSEHQREQLIIDAKREMEYGWSDKEVCAGSVLKTYLNTEPETFVPYPKCDDFEFNIIRMAIKYACGRQTIASATLPAEIIQQRYQFMLPIQRRIVLSDLKEYLKLLESNDMNRRFGDKIIDDKAWQKFMAALDAKNHFDVFYVEDDHAKEIRCFKCNVMNMRWNEELGHNEFIEETVTYPLYSYLTEPFREIFIDQTQRIHV